MVDDDDFDVAAADAAQLVLLTETVQTAKVSTVASTSTPVITFKADLFEVLGLAGDGDSGRIGGTRRITIDNPDHPLAGGLSGQVTVLSRSSTVSYASLASSEGLVATRGSSGADRALVFTVDEGDELANGEEAPGRRIGGFLARGAVPRLTEDGWILFDAMVDYGLAGAGSGANRAPVISDQQFSVPDNAESGDVVGTVIASDPDGDPLAFSLDDSGAVAIDPATGVLTVVDIGRLITGPIGGLPVGVTVSDPAGLISSATVRIDVTPFNDPPVVEDQTFTVAENADVGEIIGTVVATDPEEDSLTFSLDEDGTVAIAPDTGELSVVTPASLPDAGSELILTVTATDPDGASDDAEVTVVVTEVTGSGPVATVTSYEDGQTIDIGSDGFLPMLAGTIVEDGTPVADVVVSANGETESAGIHRRSDGTIRWFLPLAAPTSGVVDYTIDVVDDDGASNTTSFSLDLVAPDTDDIVVSPFVIVLEDRVGTELVSYDPASQIVSVSMDATEVVPGSILIVEPTDAYPSGLALRVDDIVAADASQLTAATSGAPWDTIFVQVGAAPVAGLATFAEPPPPDAAIVNLVTTGSLSLSQSLPSISLNGGIGEVDFTGQVTSLVVARLRVQAEWEWLGLPDVDVLDFNAALQGTASGTMSVGVSGSASASDSIELFDQQLGRGFFTIGPVPVYWTVEAEADLTASVSASADANLSSTVNAPFRLGLVLNAAGDGVRPDTAFALNGTGVQPTLEAELTAGVSVDPRLELDIWETIELGVGVRASIDALARANPVNETVCYTIDGALTPFAAAGVEIPIIGTEIPIGSIDAPGLSQNFAQGGDEEECEDRDEDGVIDRDDNCPDTPNPEQEDRDGDGAGDACDSDPDDPFENGAPGDRTGGSYGHPSLVTLDGLRYLFHGAGDYTLLASDDGEFEVQARLARAFGMRNVSFNRALAARVGPSVIAFGDSPAAVFDTVEVTLDGVELTVPGSGTPVALPGGATIRHVNRCGSACPAYQVDWPTGEMLQVGESVGDDYILSVPGERFGRVDGLLGNANGSLDDDGAARDGTVVDLLDRDQLYDVFGVSWLLDPADSLFLSEADPDEILPIFPTDQITLADLPAADVAAAEALCRQAGIMPGAGLDQCTFDVAITGFSEWITSALAMSQIVEESTSVVVARPTITVDENIILGQAVSDFLGDPFEVHQYNLVGLAGQELLLRFGPNCFRPFTFRVDVFTASGAQVASRSAANCADVLVPALPADGTYSIRVYDTVGERGFYGFTVSEADPTAIDADVPVVGRIDPAGDFDLYNFTGEAGQLVFFDVLALDGGTCGFSSLQWKLTAPSGDVLFDGGLFSCASDVDTFALPESGSYTLVMDGVGDEVSDYTFEVVSVPVDVSSGVSLDVPVSGRIDVRGETDTYTFDGVAGALVFFDVVALDGGVCGFSSLSWELTAPSGSVVFDRSSSTCGSDVDTFALPESGSYTLVMDGVGDEVSDYTFEVVSVPVDVSSGVSLDVPVSGRIDVRGETDTYTFDGVAGALVFFDVVALDGGVCGFSSLSWELTAPSGSVVFDRSSSTCGSDVDTFALPESGSYTLVMDGVGDEVSDYTFEVVSVPVDVSSGVSLDVPVSGRIDVRGETDTYTFDGVAGALVFFDVVALDGGVCGFSSLSWELTAPSGSVVFDRSSSTCGSDVDTFALPESGSYTLVMDGVGDEVSDYTFEVVSVPVDVSSGVSLDVPVSGRIDVRGETDTYTFSATAADELFFDVTGLDGGVCGFSDLEWLLRAPSGAVVFDQAMSTCTAGDAGPLAMPETGSYALTVDGDGDTTSDYTFVIDSTP